MSKVICRCEKVVIPTYEISDYDKNPMFLEKRVYQGSSGRVYPHPVCEGVSDTKTDKEYNAIFLENDFILVMILPEIGGRIQRLYDKTNGYDAVYYNEVIKPALVGLAGPWISGGIEFNWPQHHRPSTFDLVDYSITENVDGSVTVWVGETERMFHTKGMAGFTVYKDKAYLEIKGQLYNPTDRPQTFLWWANPAVSVNDYTQSIFPTDVHAVMDHGKRDVSKFPIADSVYYKIDYAPGTDISRYKNIPVPTSYMAYHSDYDFIGNYDYSKKAGLMHVADHHVSPGKKQWTWGNGDFGKAWDRNLTDENGPYIELMTGVFTDNQPDFTYLKPYEEKSFIQYFMPYREAGNVKNASSELLINLEPYEGGSQIIVYSFSELLDITVELLDNEKTLFCEQASLMPAEVFKRSVGFTGSEGEGLRLRVLKNGKEILAYSESDNKNAEEIPSPAEALPAPKYIDTNEKLFLAATHLEQYRHATRSPEPYYLEGLARDATDIRLNNGYGKYLYNKGKYEESEKYLTAAVKAAVWKNPNPYDCEPYYNLGLTLIALGRTDKAYDAFFKATWDSSMQDKAFYRLACIKAGRGEYALALEFTDKSLVKGFHNLKARNLKTTLLRLLNRQKEAVLFARETEKIDPLDMGCRYELFKLGELELSELKNGRSDDNYSYIELSLNYWDAYLFKEAAEVLRLAINQNEPMLHYYLYACEENNEELLKAEKSSSLYCFPNRLTDIAVLKKAIAAGGSYACYYLGNLYYDRGRCEEAVRLWESVSDKIELPTVSRNLSLAYFNKLHDSEKARTAMEKAFALDKTDARVFFELDQLYKALNYTVENRLSCMETHRELLDRRDDLYTEYITLLNMNGQYERAYQLIQKHSFHPWEGGEGKIPAQYRRSLMGMALHSKDKELAAEYLKRALIYPENIGEGKLVGSKDNDIYYMLGKLCTDEREAKQLFMLAKRGSLDLSSAKYYNDQPPEMMYYAALAEKELGNKEEAVLRANAFIDYANKHIEDEASIDYFAVSLPDFLIFEADLSRKNRVHCLYMAALGELIKENKTAALAYAEKGLLLSCCHEGLNDIVKGNV